MTLIDSSVWIDYLRLGSASKFAPKMNSLIVSHKFSMCHPTYCEIFQGCRGKKEIQQLQQLKLLANWLEIDEKCWEEMTRISRLCVTKGINVPFSDILIYSCAHRHGTPILHNDKHFDLIKAATQRVK